MEKNRSLSIAVRGLFVSAFFAVVFNTVSASAITVTYKSYGGLFDDRSDTNVVEYNDDKTVADGSAYKEPTNLYTCSDSKIFTGWFTDKGMKQQFYLRDATEDTTVYAGYTKYAACFTGTKFGEPYIIRPNKTYNFQLWGSMSGSNHTGNGGYVAGDLLLNQERQLFVYTGNAAGYSATHTFNGGGKGEWGASGGGATDVRLVGGEWDAEGSLESRIMVAGGGGGKYNKGAVTVDIVSENQSYAGGLRSYNTNETPTDLTAYGATQTSGGTTPHITFDDRFPQFIHEYNGSFGKGGYSYNSQNATLLGRSAGGGGGYYGGAQSGRYTTDTFISGTGGSSFISGHTGSVAIASATDLTPRKDSQDNQCADGTTDNLCSIHYSGISFTNTVMIDGAGYQWTTEKGNQPVGMPNIYNSSTEMGHKGGGYAKVTTNEETFHTVTFKHADEDEFTVYVIDGEKVVRPNIYIQEKDGYRIHKWEIEGTDNEWNFNDGITEDLVLVAYQDIVTYDISYDLGTGTLSEANPATYTVETDDITLNNPNKDYYTFLGWSGTGLTGNRNKTVTIAKGSTGDRDYTANYTPIPYTVTYNLDGGTNDANNPTEYNYESNEIVLARPTKEGYTFTGWSGTDIDGEDNLDVTIPVQSHGDREYTAHWSINQYTATFDVNGGTAIDPTTITSDYNVAFGNLPETSRTGYDLDGWYTEQTGGDKISNTTTMPAEDHTYYAHWTIQTFNISYDLNGGELAQGASNPDTYTYESADINLAKPSREGYTFLGWSGTDLIDNTEDVTIAHNSLGDRSYKAEFQINEYTATFDANAGETANPETITKNYNEELGNLPETSRLGYEFLGWFTDATNGDEITSATKMPAGNVTYYAHWEIITYAIEYDLGGEDMDSAPTNDTSNPTSYTVEDADITLKAATPGDTWHYFVGWALDRDTEDGLTDNFVIDTAEAKNIKVYAIFQANPYTVTLDPGNGDDEIVKTVRGDQEIGELPTPERAGYEFLGWFVGDKQIDEHFHPRSDSIAVARWEEIPTVPDTGANSTPNTGDAIMNHIVTFAVCALALFIVVALRKRKAKNEA